MRIALVADTHVPHALSGLSPEFLDRLRGVDRILHAGDLVSYSVVETLEAIAPTTAVVGNMDPPEVRARLRKREVLTLAGRKVGLAHGHQRHALQDRYIGSGYDAPEFEIFYQAMAAQLPGAEIIVFGHFHEPVVKNWNGILFLSPGAVGRPHRRATYAVLELGADVAVRIVGL
jgi:putative phosphoesterase